MDDDAEPAGPEPAGPEPAGLSRPQYLVPAIIVGTAALIGVIVVVAVLISGREPKNVRHEGQRLVIRGRVDSFDRPDNPAGLLGPRSLPWTVGAGTFGVVDNQAFVAPAPARAMAVVNLAGPDGEAAVRVTNAQTNAGLVFRYRDPANYWAVVVVQEYASWAIVRTVNGRSVGVANTGFSPTSDGTLVGVRVRGDNIDVTLNGTVMRTVTDRTLRGATGVGITAMGADRSPARFDDFIATVR